VSNPQILVRSTVGPQASLLPRVRLMVSALSNAGICTRKGLMEKWRTEPGFLLDAYLYWIPPVLHAGLRLHVGREGFLKGSDKLGGEIKAWKNETNDF
jgi:hypothetical protein